MNEEPRYPQILVDVPSDDADEAAALLFELGAEGVEQRDEGTLEKGPGAARATLVASFATREEARRAAEEISPEWAPRIAEIVGDAWRDEWKKHFVPFRLTSRITIRPPWQSYATTDPDEMVLELEPGRAFGTGLHATTALVARALESRADLVRGSTVLDVGTGSGILALVALALGATRARAIDIDPDAVAVAHENAERNSLAGRLDASTEPLDAITEMFGVVTANIEARVLIPLAPHLAFRIRPGGFLVLSGILGGQEGEVCSAFASLAVDELCREGEWVAIVLRG